MKGKKEANPSGEPGLAGEREDLDKRRKLLVRGSVRQPIRLENKVAAFTVGWEASITRLQLRDAFLK